MNNRALSASCSPNIRVAVLGAGGLGRGMVAMLAQRSGLLCVALADTTGYCYQPLGLGPEALAGVSQVDQLPEAVPSKQAIIALLQEHGQQLDALFLAIPNLPVTLYAETMRQIAESTPFQGVVVDALKRTQAVEHLLPLDGLYRSQRLLHITGAGATPGFLTTVAAVAAQSFVEVLSVDIHFGVGVANWEAYRATIREDFLHLEGFDAERVQAMTDAEIESELNAREGLLHLTNMEHADDIILELAGVCPRDRVTVGGVVDTRHAKKPVSTTVTITGRTVSGAVGSHRFVVSDECTMVDNVCGPAVGFICRAALLHQHGTYGLLNSAELMPRFKPKTMPYQASSLALPQADEALLAAGV
ncbi:MAG: saccharopine dehydrogenase-like oxidoreductase [Candidatus Melainabacteria bacterium]|nr:saccharopine dehydrogenase-like oxidoreductase [Candidatus Melainabacteria bacterium]